MYRKEMVSTTGFELAMGELRKNYKKYPIGKKGVGHKIGQL